MPSQYSAETKAEAMALIRQGSSAESAAYALGLPPRTVQGWNHRWRQIAAEEGDRELLEEDYRIALRYTDIIHNAAEWYEADPTGERAAKNLVAINAVRNTPIDKIIARQKLLQDRDQPNQLLPPMVIFVSNPDTHVAQIQGEALRDAEPKP